MAIQFPLQKKLDDTLSIYATQESLYDLSDQMIAFSDAGHIYADDGDKATLAAANTYTDEAIAEGGGGIGSGFTPPDYTNIVRSNVLDANNTWTADQDGYLLAACYAQSGDGGGSQFKASINYYTEFFFQAAVNRYNASALIEVAKGDTVIIECTYGDAASASISASYIPPRVKPAPTATEMAYVPNYGAQREIDFSGWPGGSGTGVIEGDIFVVQETGWYLFYYAPLVSVSQPWSISTNLVVDGKIVDVNWVLTPAQTNAAFAMPMKLTWMEKGSIANIMVTCGGPGFSIQQSVNCLVLFCPPQEIVPPLVDMNNYPTNIQLSDALNTYAASLDDLYATKQELQDHITNDKGYWQTLLQVQNISVANQALLTQQQTTINSLLARVSELENNPVEPTPTYDMSNPTILKTPPLIGLLGLEIGGTNEIGTGWTSPSNGLVIVDGASTIGLLTPNWIAVNGTHVDPSNSASAVLTLIGGGGSGQFTVAADDIITESGMGNVTFYPEIG